MKVHEIIDNDLILDLARASNCTPADVEAALTSASAGVAGCMASLLHAARATQEMVLVNDLAERVKHDVDEFGRIGKVNKEFLEYVWTPKKSRNGKVIPHSGARRRAEYFKLRKEWRSLSREIRLAFEKATWFSVSIQEINVTNAIEGGVDDEEVDPEQVELMNRIAATLSDTTKASRRTTRRVRRDVREAHEAAEDGATFFNG